jgi:hypothetical protein
VNTPDKPGTGGTKDIVGIIAGIIDGIAQEEPIEALYEHVTEAEEVFTKTLTPMQGELYRAQNALRAAESRARHTTIFVEGMSYHKSLQGIIDDPDILLRNMPSDVELEAEHEAEIRELERLAEKLEANYAVEIGLIQKMADSINARKEHPWGAAKGAAKT